MITSKALLIAKIIGSSLEKNPQILRRMYVKCVDYRSLFRFNRNVLTQRQVLNQVWIKYFLMQAQRWLRTPYQSIFGFCWF